MSTIDPRPYPPTKPRKIAYIGLGEMGGAMAGHLATAGHELTVHDISQPAVDAWLAEFPGRVAASPREAAEGVDIVCACVVNDEQVRAITLGPDGAFAGMAPGTVFTDHATVSPGVARELHRTARGLGLHYLDAPVSGAKWLVRAGQLAIMCGGDVEAFDAARQVLEANAAAVTLLGGPGSGQLAKLVNQICSVGVISGIRDAITLGQAGGLDMAQVFEAIEQGAAGSWHMKVRGGDLIAGAPTVSTLMRKDLAMAKAEADAAGVRVPLVDLVRALDDEIQAAKA